MHWKLFLLKHALDFEIFSFCFYIIYASFGKQQTRIYKTNL